MGPTYLRLFFVKNILTRISCKLIMFIKVMKRVGKQISNPAQNNSIALNVKWACF